MTVPTQNLSETFSSSYGGTKTVAIVLLVGECLWSSLTDMPSNAQYDVQFMRTLCTK